MNIILTSTNPSKKRSLENALNELNIIDYSIICIKVDSEVSSKPIGYEMIRGCENRNQNAKKYALNHNIDFDYLCSIEGGFESDSNGLPFVVTYSMIEDFDGNKSTGKSLGIRLSKEMYKFVRDGGSLNVVIENICENTNNKQKQGITGYLSKGLLNRDKVDKDAIISAFVPIIYQDERTVLNEAIDNSKKIKQKKISYTKREK